MGRVGVGLALVGVGIGLAPSKSITNNKMSTLDCNHSISFRLNAHPFAILFVLAVSFLSYVGRFDFWVWSS